MASQPGVAKEEKSDQRFKQMQTDFFRVVVRERERFGSVSCESFLEVLLVRTWRDELKGFLTTVTHMWMRQSRDVCHAYAANLFFNQSSYRKLSVSYEPRPHLTTESWWVHYVVRWSCHSQRGRLDSKFSVVIYSDVNNTTTQYKGGAELHGGRRPNIQTSHLMFVLRTFNMSLYSSSYVPRPFTLKMCYFLIISDTFLNFTFYHCFSCYFFSLL